MEHVAQILNDIKDIPGPKLLHCVTVKGKGYQPAESGSPTTWHAPGLFDKSTGEIKKSVSNLPKPPKFQDVFGHSIIELAKQDGRIVGVTPAMPSGCSMKYMLQEMPDRTFDVGIAEQHAVTFSAGMGQRKAKSLSATSIQVSCSGHTTKSSMMWPFKICMWFFCLDRGGVVGADGPTHHGGYDLAYMRCVPNMVVAAPMDEIELRNMMYSASQKHSGPYSIRYPRGTGSIVDWKQPFEAIPLGQGRRIKTGKDLAILSIGAIGTQATEAILELEKRGIDAAHYDMRFVKPLDEIMLHEIFGQFDHVITLEDGCVMGGF